MTNRFTQKAQNVLNLALQSASEMGHTYIGSEHLLLGFLKEGSCIAAHLLTERGASAEKVQAEIAQLAGTGTPIAVSAANMTPRTRRIIEASLSHAHRNGSA